MGAKDGNFTGIFDETNQDSEITSAVKPERNLLAAIMARAICDAFGTAHCERHLVRSARCWLFAEINLKRPFSFGWVCRELDLNPNELQDKLRATSKEEMVGKISILRS